MIIMHHLRKSRAMFMTAFLEELGLDYELRLYDRNEVRRAPPELREVHPLGKSPVIEDNGMIIAESGVITTYLIDTYDSDLKFAPARDNREEYFRYLQWLHYAEGSAASPLLLNLLTRREDPKPPIVTGFAKGELALHLGYMEAALEGQDYILGNDFSGADVGCSSIAMGAKQQKLLDNYPNIDAYAVRITTRPAFQKAFAKTGG
ncbi:MAG: glutathione S-transferase family protein [Alphaproteobacteria bacterium]|jgi:glutathione S-transferase|nr:glutathione S-transferase family protein [Alphaproteobacteria bacterium]